MSEENRCPSTAPIWNRLDQHSAQLVEMQREQGRFEGRLEAMSNHIDRSFKDIQEMFVRMDSKMDSQHKDLQEKIGEHSAALNQSKGSYQFGAWALGTVLAVIVTIAAVWNIAFGA